MSPKITVSLETARHGGMDWLLHSLARQTFQDFELIVTDGCYYEREGAIKTLAAELGISLVYIREEFPYRTGHVRATDENLILLNSQGDCIVFMDDYHIIPENYLETHYEAYKLGCAGICNWEHVRYMGQVDYLKQDLVVAEKDPRLEHLKSQGGPIPSMYHSAPWDWWWPSSSSVPRDVYIKVGGFNEMYNGGTGGEDCDTSFRMMKSGLNYIYFPECTLYHIQHGNSTNPDRIPMRNVPHRDFTHKCNYNHDRRPFTRNEHYADGDPNLIENDTLFTWYDQGYKLFRCKHCGEIGAIDGSQMLSNTKSRFDSGICHAPTVINIPDKPYECLTNQILKLEDP